MFETLVIILGVLIVILLWINNTNQKDIYNKLWQLHASANEIHSLLVKKL